MIDNAYLVREWSRVNDVTNNLAEVIKVIKDKMQGRGISPADVPIVSAKLQQIEDTLRQIGSNKDHLVPVDAKIEIPLALR